MWRARASLCFLVSCFIDLWKGRVQLSISCVTCVSLLDYFTEIPVLCSLVGNLTWKNIAKGHVNRVWTWDVILAVVAVATVSQAQNWTALILLGLSALWLALRLQEYQTVGTGAWVKS